MDQEENELVCLVFRTNLRTPEDVVNISETLNSIHGLIDWSVDLDDWEKVLRVEGTNASAIRKALVNTNVMMREMPTE